MSLKISEYTTEQTTIDDNDKQELSTEIAPSIWETRWYKTTTLYAKIKSMIFGDFVVTDTSTNDDNHVPTTKAVNDAIAAVPPPATPSLNDVTNQGNSTTNTIITANITATDDGSGDAPFTGNYDITNGNEVLKFNDTSTGNYISLRSTPSGVRNITFPDNTGTIALLSDIPTSSGVQSVTGDGVNNTDPNNPVISYPTPTDIDALNRDGSNANSDVDLGTYALNAKSVKVNGTGGSGNIGLKHQSSGATAGGSESAIYADNSGNPQWKNDSLAVDALFTSRLFGAIINAFTSKTTPVDGDIIGIADSAASNSSKKVTMSDLWANYIKAKVVLECQAILTAANFGAFINGLTAKTTPVDADSISVVDSAASNVQKKVSLTDLWLNYLKSKADALYNARSMAAYSIYANNTNATANGVATTFKAIAKQTYSGTIVWTGTTAPSGATQHSYSWSQVGNSVSFTLLLNYASTGTSLTAVILSLPSDMPSPVKPDGITAVSELILMLNGHMSGTNQLGANTFRAYLRIDSSSTSAFQLIITGSSANYKNAWISGTYLTT